MCSATISPAELGQFEEAAAAFIQEIRALTALEDWLRAQPCIAAVEVRDYLLKTQPPQREILITFSQDGGSTFEKVMTVYEVDPQTFRFHELRDP